MLMDHYSNANVIVKLVVFETYVLSPPPAVALGEKTHDRNILSLWVNAQSMKNSHRGVNYFLI